MELDSPFSRFYSIIRTISFGQLLQGLKVSDIANEQEQFLHAFKLIGDAGQSREKEIANGKPRRCG